MVDTSLFVVELFIVIKYNEIDKSEFWGDYYVVSNSFGNDIDVCHSWNCFFKGQGRFSNCWIQYRFKSGKAENR